MKKQIFILFLIFKILMISPLYAYAISEEKGEYFDLLTKLHEETNAPLENDNDTEILRVIDRLKEYEFIETFEALYIRYENEILKSIKKSKTPSKKILFSIVFTIKSVAHAQHLDAILELRRLSEVELKQFPFWESLDKEFIDAINNLGIRSTKMRSFDMKVPSEQRQTLSSASNRRIIEEIENKRITLNQQIKGQPEVVDRLIDLEYRRVLYGSSMKPEILILMGSPGTGKDTTAESYVDVVHGQKDAHYQHLFRLPVLKQEADLWGVLGSSTGFIGSLNFPPFLKFLVDHSGGRYELKERSIQGGGREFYVIENPEWKPGGSIIGKWGPETGVVFINEFHNWSKGCKDQLLKEAIEKGIFRINNPAGGLASISVPITFIIATNEGLGLVSSRESNGQRFGRPLNYEEMLARWERAKEDIPLLREQLMKTNGGFQSFSYGNSPGISEEFLNRLPDRAFFLMRPLSPEVLQQIVENHLKKMAENIKKGEKHFGELDVSWTKRLVYFLQKYHYLAEENARPMEDRVINLVEKTFFEAFQLGKIPYSDEKRQITLDIEENVDHTADLIFQVRSRTEKDHNENFLNNTDFDFRLRIKATLGERAKEPISSHRIRELLAFPQQLKQRVFGIDRIADRLGAAIFDAEESRSGIHTPDTATVPASVFMFLGHSSNGKTQTGKEIAKLLNMEPVIMDFSQVVSIHDIKLKILGTNDSLGNPSPSDFMKAFDRNNGRMVVIMDEIANAPLEALKSLYDILREPVVNTFSDKKPRVMSHLVIIMTGNAGEKWFESIPRGIPEIVRHGAMQDIHELMMQDPERRRRMLMNFFSSAFINRIGMSNIFFFSPLSYRSVRELFFLKISQAIEDLKPKESRRGWNIYFRTEQDFLNIVEQFENHGFILEEQGASIDRFVRQDFSRQLRHLLNKEEVPSGKTVILDYDLANGLTSDPFNPQVQIINIKVHVEEKTLHVFVSQESPLILNLSLRGKELVSSPRGYKVDQVLVAMHEAGHEIVRKFYFFDSQTHQFITIKPGVTEIADRFVYYLGLARSKNERTHSWTREVVLREMAVLYGGVIAQALVTKGSITDAGKSNDMERATKMAYDAILRFGLSKKWGEQTLSSDVSNEVFIGSLSEEKKILLINEVNDWMIDAKKLAETALLMNLDNALIPLGIKLAEMGTMETSDLDQFYLQHTVHSEGSLSLFKKFIKYWTSNALLSKFSKYLYKSSSLVPELLPSISMPKEIADIEAIRIQERRAKVADVKVPSGIAIYDQRESSLIKEQEQLQRKKTTEQISRPCASIFMQ